MSPLARSTAASCARILPPRGRSSTRSAPAARATVSSAEPSEATISAAAGESSASQLVEACKDPEIPRWTAVPDPYTAADAAAWVRGDPLPTEPPGDRVSFAIAEEEDDARLLGSMSIMRLERGHSGEIGYW